LAADSPASRVPFTTLHCSFRNHVDGFDGNHFCQAFISTLQQTRSGVNQPSINPQATIHFVPLRRRRTVESKLGAAKILV